MAKFNLKKAILENKATFFSSLTEGQFSWMTQDTGQQIGSQDENQIPVYMFDDKGKYYYENDYDGYGVFGGKDYYDLVAEMNGYTADNVEEFGGMFNDLRGIGIKLSFDELKTKNEDGDILFPALVTKPDKFNYKQHNFAVEAETDPNQSWYAPEEEEDFIDQNDEEEYGYDDDEEELDETKEIKPTTKMKKSKLKDKIKEMILKEIESNNMEDAPENEVDFLAELEGMLSKEDVQSTNPKIKAINDKIQNDPEFLKKTEDAITKAKQGDSSDLAILMVRFTPGRPVYEAKKDEETNTKEDGLTPLQDYVYNYEIEISGEDEAQDFLDDIKQLKTPQDVYDYYAYDRDWSGSDLNNIFRQVKRKFANLITSDDLTPLQRTAYSYTKERFGNAEAKKSLDLIKTFKTQQEFNDWVDIKIKDEDDFNKAKRAKEGTTLKKFKNVSENATTDIEKKIKSGEIDPKEIEAAAKKAISGDSADLALMMAGFGKMFEAKKDEETDTEEVTDDVTDSEETVDVTDDFSMEEPQDPGKIDVTQNANADLTGTKKDVQDNLEAALEAARALGDEKLATQVGNTITFFNKQHVVKDTPVAENINEAIEFFEMDSEFEGAMEAGDQTEEEYLRDIINTPSPQIDLSGYYEVENAVDQGDYSKGQAIKLMKSWAKDKMNELGLDKSKNINEVMFPMLKKILK